LARLFREHLNKEYTHEQYEEQFTIHIQAFLAKIARIENEFQSCAPDASGIIFKLLDEQRERLIQAQEVYGDHISPSAFSRAC